MPPIDERREWQERVRASRLSRPDAWPPPIVESDVQLSPPPNFKRGAGVEVVHKLFSGVWGIILILVAAFGGGAAAVRFLNDYPTKSDLKDIRDSLAELRKAQENDQRANETTFATIQSDIRWLKEMNKVQAEEPIRAKKPPR